MKAQSKRCGWEGKKMAEENEMMLEEENEVRFCERRRLLFFGLPWTFTKYTITDDMLTVDEGLLRTEENDCYMYKVQDVRLTATLIEKMFGLSTIICYTGDVTNPELHLTHIKHGKEIKNYLLKASETARIKRRTLNMQDIGATVEHLDDF